MSVNENHIILSGLFWTFFEKIGSQGISLVVSVILARLLMPEQFGLIAMLSIVMSICNIFIDCGFGAALIQKKNPDSLDFNTVLYSSTLIGFILYTVAFFCAPLCAKFFSEPQLTAIMRIYTLSFFWTGYSSILLTYISKRMQFKKMFKRTIISTIASGIVGIFMAYTGAGVWALVAQSFIGSILGIIVLQVSIEWKPKFQYSWSRAKELLPFGSKIMLASLIGSTFDELKGVLIGKMYSAADLAQFNRGGSIPCLLANNINSSLGTVLFPAMSMHNNKDEIRQMTRRTIQFGSYVQFFFLTTLIVISEPLVKILLTEKWINCVPFMQMFCLQKMLEIISTANLQALKAVGEGNIIVKLEIFKKPIFLAMTIAGASISVYAIAATLPIYALYANLVNMWPNKTILKYGILNQIRDLMPATLLSLLIFVAGYPINFTKFPDIVKILCGTFVCATIYIIISHITKIEAFTHCIQSAKMLKNNLLNKSSH